jgi:hypothetical protein
MNKEFEASVEQGVELVQEITKGICDLKTALKDSGSVEAFASAHKEVKFLADRATVLQTVAPRSTILENLQKNTREAVNNSAQPLEDKIRAVLAGFALAGLMAKGSIPKQMEAIMAYFPLLSDLITEYNNQTK